MKITIITVCYNSGKTIERAIKSVIAQQYSDLEYIIIDGGSTDNTGEILRKYEEAITYCVSEPDSGIYDAMNKGVLASTGDIIAFLNSDDWYESKTLERVEKYFIQSDADMVSGGICCVKNEDVSIIHSRSQNNADDYFFDIGFPHPSLFVSAELFKKYGLFNTDYKIAADYDWMLRVCLAKAKVLVVDDCFTFFSYGGVSTLRRYDALKEQYKAAFRAMQYYKKEYLEEKIRAYYEREFYYAKRELYYNRAIKHKADEIGVMLNTNKGYYIWGVGERGKQCKELFAEVGVDIIGFIDSYASISEYEGYCVLRPAGIERDAMVCVTPKKYENEITVQLMKMGIAEDSVLLFSNLVEKIIQIGESVDYEDYSDYRLL